MAELIVKHNETPGIKKEIDEGAWGLVFQALQREYSFPIPSFIRESVSNGLDAVKEREIARDIIKNGSPITEHYRDQQDGKLLKDSEFDRDYYNFEHLGDSRKVVVEYTEGSPRDKVRILDQGVGLGKERLKGFFKLGFSTKRNLKAVIGKWGMGAKAGLSTGMDYFIMTTNYNGYKTSFMIFDHDYDPITPECQTGFTDVWNVTLDNGSTRETPVHWEPTYEPNGVIIELEVKKHNKEAFIDATKNQFQYFGGAVQLVVKDLDGNTDINDLDSTPLYESNNLLIPEYSTYNAPHILVDGINYGLISWQELELQNRPGRLAIKVAATDVDVNLTREALKWSDRTKQAVNDAIKKAEVEAGDYVTEMLAVSNMENIFELIKVYNQMGKNGHNKVSTVFSKFLDMHNIRPTVELKLTDDGHMYSTINSRLDNDLMDLLFYKFRPAKVTANNYGEKVTLSRDKNVTLADWANYPIIVSDKSSLGPKMASHLMTKYNTNAIIQVKVGNTGRVKDHIGIGKGAEIYDTYEVTRYTQYLLDKYCTLALDTYEVQYDETEEEEKNIEGKVIKDKVNLALQRKLNAEVLYTYYESERNSNYRPSWPGADFVSRKMYKHTVKISDLESHFSGEDVVLCTGKHKHIGQVIETANWLFPGNKIRTSRKVKVIYVAMNVYKHFAPFCTTFDSYMRRVNPKTGELMIGENIKHLNTLLQVEKLQEEYPTYGDWHNLLRTFCSEGFDAIKFQAFSKESKGRTLRSILQDTMNHDSKFVDEIYAYLEVLKNFQDVVQTGDKELISKSAMEMFQTDAVSHIDAYDKDFINSVKAEMDRIKPITPLLSDVGDTHISEESKQLLNILINTIKK